MLWNRFPAAGSAISGFVTFSMGDVIIGSQKNSENNKMYVMYFKIKKLKNKFSSRNYCRSLQIGVLGAFMNSVALRIWYKKLDQHLGSSMADLKIVFAKCVLDQIVYAPFAIISYFTFSEFITLGFCRETFSIAKAKCSSDLFKTWVADCTVWPSANWICFRYVFVQYRPIFTNFVQLGWQIYLSSVATKASTPQSKK